MTRKPKPGAAEGAEGAPFVPPPDAVAKVLSSAPNSDAANGMRFARDHGRNVRYSFKTGKWYLWDGKRWVEDWMGRAQTRAVATARNIFAECADGHLNADEAKARAAWAHKSHNNREIKAMLERAQPSCAFRIEDTDGDPFLFNLANGTLDLRTSELLPHTREHLITRLAGGGLAYDPNATCPTWTRFLEQVMDGRHDLIAFLQRAIGYSLTGNTREQVMLILYGAGSNGKSTFLNVVMELLGEYGHMAASKLLLAKRNPDAITNDLADLRGARYVCCSETPQGRFLDEELVKQMTGGELITARRLRENNITFPPLFKLWLSTNHKPSIKGTDHGIWRRLLLVPFERTFAKEERDTDLADKLRAEMPGILNWALEGCLVWQSHGLEVPEEIRAAVRDYREEMDVLGEFLGEHARLDDAGAFTSAAALYGRYKTWAEAAGEKAVAQKQLGLMLKERGYVSERQGTPQVRGWRGIELVEQQHGYYGR